MALKAVPAVAEDGVEIMSSTAPVGVGEFTVNVCVVMLVLAFESVTVRETVYDPAVE